MTECKLAPEISGSLYATENDARIYDMVYGATERRDIPFWIQLVKQVQPGNILEIGVGTGRVAIPLARAGFNVVGLDLEKAMLEVAREKTSRLPQRIQDKLDFIQGDARSIDLDETFDLITIPLNTFCHFVTQEDQVKVLKNLKKHLDPENGVMAIDTFNEYSKVAQKWNSAEQGPIPVDRPPFKIVTVIDTKKSLWIERVIRDYKDNSIGTNYHFGGGDNLFVDRECNIVDFSAQPPQYFTNRAVFRTSYFNILSLVLDGPFQQAGFNKAKFLGDYRMWHLADAQVSHMNTVTLPDSRLHSEKIIIITGPGQEKVKVKPLSSRKIADLKNVVKDTGLEFILNGKCLPSDMYKPCLNLLTASKEELREFLKMTNMQSEVKQA